MIAMEDNRFLIDYLPGLSDEQYAIAMEKTAGDMNKLWDEASKLNIGGIVLFDGKEVSAPINKPEILGYLNKYVSKNEIWFTPNYSEVEKDYVVLYKTGLTAKQSQ